MKPTNVGDPNYYHRVVDCQWACPAHTNVPEYIRLIAQGKFTEAYLVNRESNVFPGILGRTCDRPCEPACRRTRVDGKPVAICRLKRVAADNRDEVKHLLPTAPEVKNGKKIGLIGAGPASLTVANDLTPLGYEVTILEKLPRPGGLMRINIPAFRLPEQVLDEEIGYILDMGVEVRYNSPVESLKGLLDSGEFDAVFVGSGAPKGKELEIPGRHDTDQIFIGIEWLESIHFGHVDSVGKRVLIIGVGNTAMDCCRSSKRLGATDVKVIARKTRKYFKASPWELEDAEEEGVEIIENLQPVRFIIENGVLTGMEFEKFRSVETDKGLQQEVIGREILPCDTVVLAIGQDNAFPFIERGIGLEFGKWDMPVVDKTTFMSTRPGVFFGGDAGLRSGEHHLGRRAGAPGGNLDSQLLPGVAADRAAGAGHDAHQHQDGAARVGVQQQLQRRPASEDEPRRPADTVREHVDRSGEGLHRRADARRGRALPQLRHGDALHRLAVYRVRCVRRYLPRRLPHDYAQRRGARPAHTFRGTGIERRAAALRVWRAEANRPGDDQERTSACTAGCAPSDARPTRGTCASSCCRFLTPARP